MTKEKDIFLENIEFILSHFNGQELLFPRSIMTAKTNGQVFVDSEKEMIDYFTKADFVDCRINGYPFHRHGESRNLYPSFIFIDLDLSSCSTCKYPIRKLDYILKQTLKKIDEEFSGHATVLWTGGGYYIYQPIMIVTKDNEKLPLEDIKEFEDFKSVVKADLTNEFIRYAGKYLTNQEGDPKHDPSIYSCLIRIPGTTNSKYGNKVNVIQKWDGMRVDVEPLIHEFGIWLTQQEINLFREKNKRTTTKKPQSQYFSNR